MAYDTAVRIEWDPEKDRSNRAKHGLGFDEARSLLEGEDNYLLIHDAEHSHDEDRFVAVGPIPRGVIVVVFAGGSDDVVRIISARMATRRERALCRKRIVGTTS